MKIGFVKPLCLLFAVWWSSILLADSQVEELFNAVNKSNVEQVAALLEKGVDVNASLKGRGTDFYAIMLVRNAEVARLLITAGAKVDVTDGKDGKSALHWVIERTCSAEVAEVLIEDGGADPNATVSSDEFPYPLTTLDWALMFCALGGEADGVIEMLLNYGGDGKFYRELLEKKNKE